MCVGFLSTMYTYVFVYLLAFWVPFWARLIILFNLARSRQERLIYEERAGLWSLGAERREV